MERLRNSSKSYWDHAEYITRETQQGRTLTSVAEELSISLQNASKYRTAYKRYVLEYGIDIKILERMSIYDLHDAHGKALQLVKDKESAEHLVNLLRNGRDFNDIRKEAKVAAKPRAEHVIEDIEKRQKAFRVSKSRASKHTGIVSIVGKYHKLISECRDNPMKAERLLVDCFVEVSNLYVET